MNSDQPDMRGATDQIFLTDYVIELDIGAFEEERAQKQRVAISVWVDVGDTASAGDDVDSILSYDTILEAIVTETKARRYALLEALAEAIAQRVLKQPMARSARVRIEKLDRTDGRLGIEIKRESAGAPTETGAGFPGFELWFVSDVPLESLQSTDLRRVVIARGGVVEIKDAELAERARLFAMDLAAVELADHLGGSPVTDSKTELAHLMADHPTVCLAPSRVVRSVSAEHRPDGAQPAQLAAWLAQDLGASALVFVGCEVPEDHAFEGDVRSIGPNA